jgi:two-component system, NarL family, invasion response regulator UvrY
MALLALHTDPCRKLNMIKIVVADDHQLIREGIKKILLRESDFMVVAEAWDLPSLLAVLDGREVDVLLLDLGLAPPNELAVLRLVRERCPAVPVIIISSHDENRFAIDALREGASGYVSKSMTVDVVVKAVRKVHAGGRYVSETLADLIAQELASPKPEPPHSRLTARELQVFQLLAAGLPIKKVAANLDISISSVNTYRTRVLTKMRMKTSAELMRYAIQHGLAG